MKVTITHNSKTITIETADATEAEHKYQQLMSVLLGQPEAAKLTPRTTPPTHPKRFSVWLNQHRSEDLPLGDILPSITYGANHVGSAYELACNAPQDVVALGWPRYKALVEFLFMRGCIPTLPLEASLMKYYKEAEKKGDN